MKMAYLIKSFKVLNDVNDPSKGWIIKYKIVEFELLSFLLGLSGIIFMSVNSLIFVNVLDIVKNIILITGFFSLILISLFSDDVVDKVFDSKEEAKEYRKKLFDIKFNA